MYRDPALAVKWVTTVLEPDMESDSMEQEYTEVVISGKAENRTREKDIEEEFDSTMTREPGLMKSVEFPYNTPLS